MKQYFRNEQCADYRTKIMETRGHFKNWASPKSLMSRRNVESNERKKWTEKKKLFVVSPVTLVSLCLCLSLLSCGGGSSQSEKILKKDTDNSKYSTNIEKKDVDNLKQGEMIEKKDVGNSKQHETNIDDSNWLIGVWGPITISDGPFSEFFELQITIKIIDKHSLIMTTRTTLTPEGIQLAKDRGTYKENVTESKETHYFTIDTQENVIKFNDPQSAPIPFDKNGQWLNFGTKEKPRYMKKQK
jgi:hypothetical protein